MVSIENVQRILSEIDNGLKHNYAESFNSKKSKSSRWFLYSSVPLFVLGLLITLPVIFNKTFYGDYQVYAKYLAVSTLLLSQVIVVIDFMVQFVWTVIEFKTTIRKPLAPFFEITKKNSSSDFDLYYSLMNEKKEDLKYAFLQFKNQRETFQQREGLFIGSLSKIGFLPAFLGYLVALQQLHIYDLLINLPPPWYVYFLFAVPVFYLMGTYFESLLFRIDRGIALLEYIIYQKENDKLEIDL